MISPADFFSALENNGLTYFTGVPDSLLKDLCAYITDTVPAERHVINANEGAAVALAVGYHLATGKTPVVYLQNSGTGNIVNPLLSLADPAVYRVPVLFIIGWRGEPGSHDEPQHVTQGRIMLSLLDALELRHEVIDAETNDVDGVIRRACDSIAASGSSHVLLVRKGTFSEYKLRRAVQASLPLSREQALEAVLDQLDARDVVVSTTGMASREVFEYRERRKSSHTLDFLTVGSMGHCSQIALGLAQHQPSRHVFCVDGDGAMIMHMGSLAIVGAQQPGNFRHVVINNGAHDSVGGQPTAASSIDICAIALACGYVSAEAATSVLEIVAAVGRLRAGHGPGLLEVRVNIGARKDLGRPTKSPLENKLEFMRALSDG